MKNIIAAAAIIVFSLSVLGQPEPKREFRAVWIATVDNIDFPSRKALTAAEQRAELVRDLDLARRLGFNAVIFQVRPQCDAMYESRLEPWSEYLTGEMGKSQDFDPLRFLITEAHARGILVHAWFNPYRALHPSAKTVSENHISKRRPDLVRKYGRYLWLDPSEPEVQRYSLRVVLDVVRRYDVDGVHFDDYFYPYKEKDQNGKEIEFPDTARWEAYVASGGGLSRPDWRRSNVDSFISAVGRELRRLKPHVMYGISPFGIWQPMPELGISGFNAYSELYADARKWLRDGTVDYMAPQLYWETARQAQSFPVLLDWWKGQNPQGRHIWPGIAAYRIGSTATFTAEEIARQIGFTRLSPQTAGSVQFSFRSLRNDMGAIQEKLSDEVFRSRALVPRSPWKKPLPLKRPRVGLRRADGRTFLSWNGANPNAFWMLVQVLGEKGWREYLLPVSDRAFHLEDEEGAQRILVTASDRLGNLGPPADLRVPSGASSPPKSRGRISSRE